MDQKIKDMLAEAQALHEKGLALTREATRLLEARGNEPEGPFVIRWKENGSFLRSRRSSSGAIWTPKLQQARKIASMETAKTVADAYHKVEIVPLSDLKEKEKAKLEKAKAVAKATTKITVWAAIRPLVRFDLAIQGEVNRDKILRQLGNARRTHSMTMPIPYRKWENLRDWRYIDANGQEQRVHHDPMICYSWPYNRI
jgi:hypothetical protein